MKTIPRTSTLLLMWLVGWPLVACKRDQPPPSAVTAKSDQTLPPGHPAITGSEPLPAGHPPLHAQGGAPGTAAPMGGGALAWTLPSGWTEERGGGMRLATLKPPSAGVEVSVVMLSGPAGGELGNVNRWRGQLGLPAIDEAARAGMRKAVRTKVGEVSLYDFTGTTAQKPRMLAGLLVRDGQTWFFKMTGAEAAVGAAQGDFVRLLESLRTT